MKPQDQAAALSAADADVGDLETMRAELDELDRRLLATLSARIECCVRIAEHKRRYGIPMMQPHRIDAVQNRAARYAEANNIDAVFLRQVYDLIIAETCRVEDLVIDGAPKD
jgi:chorismate mutase